jgi:hypothetical protein
MSICRVVSMACVYRINIGKSDGMSRKIVLRTCFCHAYERIFVVLPYLHGNAIVYCLCSKDLWKNATSPQGRRTRI